MEYNELNYQVTKQNTPTKIGAEVKAAVMDVITRALEAEFGPDAVGMARIASTTSKSNKLTVIVGTAESDTDGETPIVLEIDASVKKFVSGNTKKGDYKPFDVVAARAAYDAYIAEKAEKDAETAAKKAAKIAKDKAAREAAAQEG